MKYIVYVDIDPDTGVEVEAQPEKIQEMIAKWQEHEVLGMYFSLTSRFVTIIVEAEDEGDFFEALHYTWVLTRSYPEVSPVVDVEEFPDILRRTGVA